MNEVLGVDIGGVIIDAVSEDATSATVDRFATAAPIEGAFETIARLVNDRFQDRVWLVSRCDEESERRILDWLTRHNFFAATGIARSRVLFCRERSDKAQICASLGVTHFVDDRLEVLSHLVGKVPNLYCFRSRARDVERFRQFLPHVREVGTWDAIRKELLS